jgi:hypothetical protein
VTQRSIGLVLVIGMAGVALFASGCAKPNKVRNERLGLANTGPGSLTAERKALEGSWTLASLEMVDEQGTRRTVKASGQLTYDAYSNMTVRGVIEEPGERNPVVLDYQGRIFIDPVRHEFYPADLRSDRPVEPGQGAAIAPDKVRRYELTADTFVVTYLDASAKTTAVARWRRP